MTSSNEYRMYTQAPVEEPAAPVSTPQQRTKLIVIGVIVAALVAVATVIGVSTSNAAAGPTKIQQAVATCHAPTSWIGDKGHSLEVTIDSTTPDAQTAKAACIWPKIGMPDSVRNRMLSGGAGGVYSTSSHTVGDWPGYHATLDTTSGEFWTLYFVVSQR